MKLDAPSKLLIAIFLIMGVSACVLPIYTIETQHTTTNMVLNYREYLTHTLISGDTLEIGYYPFTIRAGMFSDSYTLKALIVDGRPHELQSGVYSYHGDYHYTIHVTRYKETTITITIKEYKQNWVTLIQRMNSRE